MAGECNYPETLVRLELCTSLNYCGIPTAALYMHKLIASLIWKGDLEAITANTTRHQPESLK